MGAGGRDRGGSSLAERLRRRILDRGPISFAEFMEAALYDPDEGFYARPPIGPDRHFVTSPHVSPAFGTLLARQVGECWDLLGRPDPFTVVELGAGDATLARQVFEGLRPVADLDAAVRYVGVERTPGQLDALRGAGFETAPSLADAGPIEGCVLANEVFDNAPFHRLRERDGAVVEVLVGVEADGFVEVEAPAPPELLSLIDRPLSAGEERPVSPAARDLVRELAASLQRGYAFLFDYAFTGAAPKAQAFLEHRVSGDLLQGPGTRDLTVAVDLDAIGREATAAGLQVWAPVTQREALLGIGYRLWAGGVRRRISREEETGDRAAAVRLRAALSASSILIDEAKLGSLSLLALGTDGLPAPAAVLGDREVGC